VSGAEAADEEDAGGAAPGGGKGGGKVAAGIGHVIFRHVTAPVQVAWQGWYVCMCMCVRARACKCESTLAAPAQANLQKRAATLGFRRRSKPTLSAPVYTCVSAPVYTGVSAPVYTGVSAPVYTGASAPAALRYAGAETVFFFTRICF
jgi:hypothetical protein